jgi:hemolysin-activating ACP:hemolysin acyltransferase
MPDATLRIFKPANPAAALGLAVSHLMVKPAFANLKFGDWSRILVGQINRGHYCFAVDENNDVQGFMGWALATREKAEAWVEGRRGLTFEDSREGECMVINAWSASSNRATRFLLVEARRIARDKATGLLQAPLQGRLDASRARRGQLLRRWAHCAAGHFERSVGRESLPETGSAFVAAFRGGVLTRIRVTKKHKE